MVLLMGSPKGSHRSVSGYESVNNYMCHMWVLHGLKLPCGTHMGNILRQSPHVTHLALCAGGIFSLGPSQQIFSHAGKGLLGLHQYYTEGKCLAQENNAVPQVRLQPAAHRSPVKHSTTKQLCSSFNPHGLIIN